MGKFKNTSGDAFVTTGFVVCMMLVRVLSEPLNMSVIIVAALNGFMFLYVFHKIDSELTDFFKSRDKKSVVCKRQHQAYKRMKAAVLILFFACWGAYIILLFIVSDNAGAGGCINDMMAFITFGLSLEDENITGFLMHYFKNKDFTI